MNLMNRPMLATSQQLEQAAYFSFKPSLQHSRLNNLAIIPIEGLLSHRFEAYGSSYERIRLQIQSALDDSAIEQIILDIDSGGGEVSGLFDLIDFIVQARNQKLITALVNEHAYSAAYIIASSANQIIAPQTASVGSIGVIVAHLDQSEAEKKIGLQFTEVYAGKHKRDFSPHSPLSDESKSELQQQVNDIYELTLQTLAMNRQMAIEVFRDTEAKIYSSNKALDLLLIDKIQSAYSFIEEQNMTEEVIDASKEIRDSASLILAERQRIKSITQMCTLAKLADCSERLIEEGISLDEARKFLFEKMVANAGEPIMNALPERSCESNELIQAMALGLGGKQHARL